MPLDESTLLLGRAEFAVSHAPECGAFEPRAPRAGAEERPGWVRLSEQGAKLKAQQRAWTGHIKEVSGAARATRPSSSSPLPRAALAGVAVLPVPLAPVEGSS